MHDGESRLRARQLGKVFVLSILFLSVWGAGLPYRAQPLEWEPGWSANLELWLRISYSESEQLAAFGDAGSDLAGVSSLYATYGSTLSLKHLGVAIDAPERIGRWVNSLLTDEGAYHDPQSDAPLIFQTYWAVTTLDALGVEPSDPERIEQFVLSLQLESGFFRFDTLHQSSLQEDDGSSGLCCAVLRTIGADLDLRGETALQRVAAATTIAIDELLARTGSNWRELSGPDAEQFKGLAVLLAYVSPGACTEREKAALAYYLDQIASTSTGFLGPSYLDNLLDVAVAVRVLTTDQIPGLSGLREYLLRRIRPELEPFGGYGWGQGWTGRLDPVMTWPTVQLFARAELDYPYRERLIKTLETYRRDEGWVTFVMVEPDPGSTLDGLGIAQEIGWTGYDQRKIRAYSASILEDPDADCSDLYRAAKLAARAGMSQAELSRLKHAAFDRVCGRDPAAEGRWLVPFLAECGLAPPPGVAGFLREQASEEARLLVLAPQMDVLWDFVLCQKVLCEEWLSVEELATIIGSLRVDGGGYKLSSDSPAADLISTAWALQSLVTIGREREADIEGSTAFVLSCQREYGFSFTPSGSELTSSDPDFGSTGLALDTLRLLRSFEEGAP